MIMFGSWCSSSPLTSLPGPAVTKVVGNIDSLDDDAGVALLAATLPNVYADTSALALIAERYGKPGVATFLRDRLPTKKNARSGDVGEILATAYLSEELDYVVGPSRLIDRDHQEWAMRGDDVLAARIDCGSELHLVKGEAKSGVTIGGATVRDARKGLSRNDEMPSPQSLSQFASRLLKSSESEVGEAVLDVQLTQGVRPEHVSHLIFLLAGNDPSRHVSTDLEAYAGMIPQLTVTLRVQHHQKFINDSYDGVVANVP